MTKEEQIDYRKEVTTNFGSNAITSARIMASPDFTRGDLASLRRMPPDNPGATAAYWRIMAELGLLEGPNTAVAENQYALILNGIALMTPRVREGTYMSENDKDLFSAHASYMPVGRALFLGGNASGRERGYYSETRLKRLLTARGRMLRMLLARMFRMMAVVDQPFNWQEMEKFILSEESDEERFEMARRNIASEYYQSHLNSMQS